MRNQGVHQSEVISTAGKIKTAVASMVSCLWEAGDILEIRLLHPNENTTKRSWHTADELPDAAASKAVINLAGWNVYCGANPRERMGAAGDRNVPIARSLFVDFDDGIDLPKAKARWGEAVIPEPTLVIDSGHGVHAYWRLRTAFINLDDWTRSQKRLIGLLNSDKVVHNPERIMRLPGTMNVKGTPHVPCKILRADPTRTYDLTSLLPPETDGTSGPFRTNDWKSALDALGSLSPSRADDYDDWLAVGQCLHSVDQSGPMLSEWDRWSRQSGKYRERDCAHRWNTFGPGRGRTVATLIHMAKQDSGANERAMSSRPQIIIGTDEKRVVDEAVRALAGMGGIYQRGSRLTYVVPSTRPPKGIVRPDDVPRIVAMPTPRLRELMASAAPWVRRPKGNDNELKNCHPPEWAVKEVEARGQWDDIPPIEAVVSVPVLRFDGTVLQRSGFDTDSGIYFASKIEFPPVPDQPTRDDAKQACGELLDVVKDFPFDKPEHKAAWLAAVLSLFARQAYAGPTPLCLIEANIRGCGKSLLADVAAIIATGQNAPRMPAPRSDDESRKRITSIAVAAEPLCLIDNVTGRLDLPSLDAALTATTWNDRVLGKSELTGNVPLNTIWFLTGNNVILGGDTVRRSMHVRLESRLEKPEERTGFAHANLMAWLQGERGRLAQAALIVLRAYWVAGCPDMKLPPWGSFEGWSRLVRSAVVWAKQPDPGKTRGQLAEHADTDTATLDLLIGAIETEQRNRDGDGNTAAEMVERAAGSGPITHCGLP